MFQQYIRRRTDVLYDQLGWDAELGESNYDRYCASNTRCYDWLRM